MEYEKSTVSILDEDILFINVCMNQEFTLMDFKELRVASLRLARNRNVFNIIFMGDKTIPTKAAREACTIETGNGRIKGEAFVVHSLGQRIVARHILKQKKKQHPVKLFTSTEKAKLWIDCLKKDLN